MESDKLKGLGQRRRDGRAWVGMALRSVRAGLGRDGLGKSGYRDAVDMLGLSAREASELEHLARVLLYWPRLAREVDRGKIVGDDLARVAREIECDEDVRWWMPRLRRGDEVELRAAVAERRARTGRLVGPLEEGRRVMARRLPLTPTALAMLADWRTRLSQRREESVSLHDALPVAIGCALEGLRNGVKPGVRRYAEVVLPEAGATPRLAADGEGDVVVDVDGGCRLVPTEADIVGRHTCASERPESGCVVRDVVARRMIVELRARIRGLGLTDYEIGQWLLECDRRGLWRELGCPGGRAQAAREVLRMSAAKANDLVRCAEACEVAPVIREAYLERRFGWTALRTVARRITAENEESYLQLLCRCSVRELERLMRELGSRRRRGPWLSDETVLVEMDADGWAALGTLCGELVHLAD